MAIHILFSGGGTLGPVMPLLAVADEVRAIYPNARFSWIGTVGGPERLVIEKKGIMFFSVSAGKFRRYASLKTLGDIFRVAAGFFQSLELLRSLRPDVVVSAGGFVAVPVIWAAWLLGIPTHVHQQDLRPGLANRLSAPFAASMSVAFEKSLADFPRNKPVWTGNPVRAALFSGNKEEARRLWQLEEGTLIILVIGGGTGAAGLNAIVAGAAAAITKTAQVIHVTGAGKKVEVPDAPMRYHQVEFLDDDIRHAYAAADLVVTRAGTGVLTELAALGKPAYVVPLPGSQQEENAKFFAEHGGAIVRDEVAINGSFATEISAILADASRLQMMGKTIRSLAKPDAAQTLAAEIVRNARSQS